MAAKRKASVDFPGPAKKQASLRGAVEAAEEPGVARSAVDEQGDESSLSGFSPGDQSDADSADIEALLANTRRQTDPDDPVRNIARRFAHSSVPSNCKPRRPAVRRRKASAASGADEDSEDAALFEDQPRRGRRRMPREVDPVANGLLLKAQDHYERSEFDEAKSVCQELITVRPGCPDPFELLGCIYREEGDLEKELLNTLYVARFKSSKFSPPYWRLAADLSRRCLDVRRSQGMAESLVQEMEEQWIECLKRISGFQGKRADEDWAYMCDLAEVYYKRGNLSQACNQIVYVGEKTRNTRVVNRGATWLLQQNRKKEAIDFLEQHVLEMTTRRKGSGPDGKPAKVAVDAEFQKSVHYLCEVLLEVMDFAKVVSILSPLFGVAARGLSRSQIKSSLQSQPADLVHKLATALIRIGRDEDQDVRECAVDKVLSSPNIDLHLQLVDCFLAAQKASTAAEIRSDLTRPPWPTRGTVDTDSMELALDVLDNLADAGFSDDVRERRAMCCWYLGHNREAADLFEELLAEPVAERNGGGRTEAEQRELRVHAVALWVELGDQQRADRHMKHLTYQDLQLSSILPQALSNQERRTIYLELLEFVSLMGKVPDTQLQKGGSFGSAMDTFVMRFRHLVSDIELDHARLRSCAMDDLGMGLLPATNDDDDVGSSGSDIETPAHQEAPAPQPGSAAPPVFRRPVRSLIAAPPRNRRAAGAAARSSLSPAPAIAAAGEGGSSAVARAPDAALAPSVHMSPLQQARTRRQHLGAAKVEDVFGFQSYSNFLMQSCDLIRRRAFARGERNVCREDLVNVGRCVELLEQVIATRRSQMLAHPIKRRSLRDLRVKSLSLAFESRLWRVVFRHLRWLHRSVGEDMANTMALVSRIIFTHEEVALLAGRRVKATDGKHRVKSAHKFTEGPCKAMKGHRQTYAAALQDIRSWALRQLSKHPHSFHLTMMAGHFSSLGAQYPLAVAEYLRAHRLRPTDAMTAMCLSASYLSFAMSRNAKHRHDLVLKGLTFMSMYGSLRMGYLPGAWLRHEKMTRLEDASQPLSRCRVSSKRAEAQPAGASSPTMQARPRAMSAVSNITEVEEEEEEEEEPADEVVAPQLPGAPRTKLCELVRRAEVAYNKGRAFHMLQIRDLASKSYENVLTMLGDFDTEPARRPDGTMGLGPQLRPDLRVVRSSAAYALAALHKETGNNWLAHQLLCKYVTF